MAVYLDGEQETRGRPPHDLTWRTPEGIDVKSLYTAADLEGLEHLDALPGFPPFVRGPRASMYAGRPWTLRQYAGYSTTEESNAFYYPPEPSMRIVADVIVYTAREMPRFNPRRRSRGSAGCVHRLPGGPRGRYPGEAAILRIDKFNTSS